MSEFKLFISYRRADTRAIAYRIHQSLCKHFGKNNIFIDEQLQDGKNFSTQLGEQLEECHVLLAIVGENWLVKTDAGELRVNQNDDFVRYEIATALDRKLRVIPVLIDEVQMPGARLTPPLHQFKDLQCVKVNAGSRYAEDIDKLIQKLEPIAAAAGKVKRVDLAVQDRCKQHDRHNEMFDLPSKAEMLVDKSDLFLLLLNAIQPNRCEQVRRYFHGDNLPLEAQPVIIEGIYDLFGRFEFLIKLRVASNDPGPIHTILADLRRQRLIPPCTCAPKGGARKTKASDGCGQCTATLLNLTHEHYPEAPQQWVPLNKERRAVKAFLHIYPWEASMRKKFLNTCHSAADHGISTLGVFVASNGDHSELVAEYYSGCGSYYDLVKQIFAVEERLLEAVNRNALLVMDALDERGPQARTGKTKGTRTGKTKGTPLS